MVWYDSPKGRGKKKEDKTEKRRKIALASRLGLGWASVMRATTPGEINQKDVLLRPFCPRLRYH